MRLDSWGAAAAVLAAAAAGAALAIWLAPYTVDPVPGFHPGAEIPANPPLEVAPASLAAAPGA